MGLLDNTTHENYYSGSEFGSYQFTSLNDIINQFLVAYVGEEKIISKASKMDVAFHAQRAMQELSFDTFKSIKAQEIVLPPSLKMILPHDYVNYTQVSWSDDSGVKHPLYPTKHTSNPFTVLQEDDGVYTFAEDTELIADSNFEDSSGTLHSNWSRSPLTGAIKADPTDTSTGANGFSSLARMFGGGFRIQQSSTTNSLDFRHAANPVNGGAGTTIIDGRVLACWQEIDVRTIDFLDLSANASVFLNDDLGTTYSTSVPDGKVIIGLQTQPGDTNSRTVGPSFVSQPQHPLYNPNFFSRNINNPDIGFIEFDGTAASTEKEATIDVSDHEYVYFIILSKVEVSTVERDATSQVLGVQPSTTPVFPIQYTFENKVNSVTLKNVVPPSVLSHANPLTRDSNTWSNYKSDAISENTNTNNSNYDTDIYDLNSGQRFGLDPSKSQANGSFYIDSLQGFINFSSNISGKTVILDYISDGLGTDEEMQVHKFAEEAMYKSIMYAIISTRANVPEYVIRRYKQAKFAATRQAKLRLSNLKLEELTQILRGKSKWIKH
jgi:hypothetical protein